MQGTSKVLSYLSETTAVVDVPRSKHNAIVESIGGPIAVKDETGKPKGIDTTLKELDSGDFSASETAVPTRFPADLADGIKLGELDGPGGMWIRPGAGGSLPTLLDGGKKLFYANTAQDTDLIAEAVANGAAVSWSLRSPKSPSLLALDMSFGVGVTLRKTEDQSVEVLFGDTVIALIEPVKAFDAQGTTVAAEYRIVDNRLSVAVLHRKQDLAYPIVVDPVTNFWGVPAYRDEFGGSTPVTNTPTVAPWAFHRPTAAMEYSATPESSGYRLKLYNTPAATGPGFYHAYLQYAPPNASTVFRAEMISVTQAPAAHAVLNIGLVNGAGSFETGWGATVGGACVEIAPGNVPGCQAYGTWGTTSGYGPLHTVVCATTGCGMAGSPGNRVRFQEGFNLAAGQSTNGTGNATTRGGYIYFSDYDAPTISQVPTYPNWINSVGPIHPRADDAGVGLGGSGHADHAMVVTRDGSEVYRGGPACGGGVGNPCYTAFIAGAVTPIEGQRDYSFKATDIIGRTTTANRTYKVDSAGPDISISGRLGAFALDNATLGTAQPRTMVTNTPFVIQALDGRRKRPDGQDAPNLDRRSGVKEISAKIYGAHANGTINTADLKHNFDPNNVPKQNDHQACDQNQFPSTALDSCKLSYSGTFDAETLDPGIYFFRVVAQDYVGNTTVKDFKVGVGSASLETVVEGQASSRYVPIQVKRERGSATSASLQYRWAVNGLWCAVPPVATRIESSPFTEAPASLALDSNAETQVVVVDMDALRQLDQTGGSACSHQDSKPRLADGLVYMRGLMAGSDPEPVRASEDVAVRFERGGLGTQNDSAEIGPGTVDLVSGNYSMSTTDVSVSAYKSDLTVTRTYNSRYWQGSNGVFGPGWRIGLPSASTGAQYIGVSDYADVGIPEDERYATVEVDTADGEFITFELSEIDGKYVPEAGFETLQLERIPDAYDATRSAGFKLIDTSTGAVASFMTRHPDSWPGEYDLTEVYESGPSEATTYAFGHDEVIGSYPTHAFSPAAGVTCREENHTATQSYAALPQGCQALNFGYAQVAGQLRLTTIKLKTFDPEIGQDGAMREDVVAQYAYDANGRLTEAWDPRQSTLLPTPTHLKTTYTHLTAADHRIGTVTPPGQQPFTITYSKLPEDSTYGRLSTVTRTSLSAGMATWSVRFFVPTSGSSAPFDFSVDETKKWGQNRPPFMSAAVFPPDQPPNGTPATNYDRASMSYLDPMGREVLAREPGDRVSVTEYDKWGSVVRTLTPTNRDRLKALPRTTTEEIEFAEAADKKWSTENHYDDVPGSPSGARHLTETLGPERSVRLDNGTAAEARTRTRYWYDGEDDPGDGIDPVDPIDPDTVTGEPFDLVTMVKVSALVETTDHDVRTTLSNYGSTEAQWKLRVPLETVTDPGSGNLQIKRKVDVNADGMETARYQPRSQNLAEPSTTRTVYYTAEANTEHSECGGTPEWRGLACKVFQGADPSTSGLPKLPTQQFTYNHLRQPLTSVEQVYDSSNDLQTRTSTVTYDEAGRVVTESVSGSVGEPVKTTKHIYSPTTGQEVETQSLNANGSVHKTISRTFDAIGRQTNYTDSEGHSSYTVYDQLSRVQQTGDSKATRIHSYDPITGDLTSINDSGTGVFSATYDQDGRVVSTSMPGGMIKTFNYTASGFQDYVSYSNSNGLVFENWATESAHGQIRELWQKIKPQGQSIKETAYEYRYDKAGRLTEVGDWRNDSSIWKCNVREYTLDEDSNRLEKKTIADQNYYCDFGGSGTTTTSAYDNADRTTDSGYQYDAFGRITTTPQAAAGGTGDFNASYYVNDLARSVSQNGTSQTLDLDPNQRMSVKTKVTGGNTTTEKYAYVDDTDSPAWIQTGTSTWQRYIGGIDGAAGVQDNTGSAKYHFVNLRGDVVASGFPDPVESAEIDEFGVPKTDLPADRRYGFHGSKQREALTSQGMIAMGVRLYAPQTGRFLQEDPVLGGTANPYEYPSDPINLSDVTGMASSHTFTLRKVEHVRYYNQTQSWTVYKQKTVRKRGTKRKAVWKKIANFGWKKFIAVVRVVRLIYNTYKCTKKERATWQVRKYTYKNRRGDVSVVYKHRKVSKRWENVGGCILDSSIPGGVEEAH